MFKQKLNKHSAPFSQNRKLLLSLIFLGLFFFSFSSTVFAQGSEACEGIKVTGVFNDDPNSDYFQGITIQNLDAPIQIIKIYNSNWERIEECSGDCKSLSAYETEAGKYFVQIQLYNENWNWICQTDNIEVIVPAGPPPPTSECGLDIISADFPTTTKPGETINLQVTLRNSTTADVSNSSVGLYQFKGGNRSFPEPKLIAETTIDYLASGESKIFYFSATLPNPLWNVPVYPIGDESFSNNFVLLTKENATSQGAVNCQFPVDFRVDYPDVDLALSLENNQGCIDSESFLLTDLKVTNNSTITAKAPIYVDLAQDCTFGNAAVVTCKVHASALRAYYIINEDLEPNQSIVIEKPYQMPNTAITEWTITAKIDALGSALDDPNEENNEVTASFTKTADCGGTNPTPDCNKINAVGLVSDQSQGGIAGSNILIDGTNAPHVVVKVYDNHWQIIEICSDCSLPLLVGVPPGNYIVQVQLYTENWGWICQTDNLRVNVPPGQTCTAVFFKDADGDGFGDEFNTVSGCSPPAGYVNNFDDCDDTNADIGAKQQQGIICNDNNPNTVDDEIQADGCTCSGSLADCSNISAIGHPSGGQPGRIEVFGFPAEISTVTVYTEYGSIYAQCKSNNFCGNFREVSVGKYFVQVQVHDFYTGDLICETERIEVIVEQLTGCGIFQSLDNDLDGFCAFEDCDDNDPNVGTRQPPGSTCDDGDPTTDNDVIQGDGCTCQGTPDTGMPNCDDVSIVRVESFAPTPGNASYMVSGLTAPIEIIKVFNRRTYEKLFECNNDCGDNFSIELQEGEYVLQIQMYTDNWGWICGKDIEFDVITTDPPNCDFSSTIDFDNLCTDCVSEVVVYQLEGTAYYAFLADNVNCSDAQTIVYSCENGNQFCVDGGIIGSIECADFFAAAQKIQTVWTKAANCDACICTQEVDPVCGSDGVTYGNQCLAECAGVLSWTRGECPTTTPDCSKVTAKFQQGLQDTYEGLGVEGLNAPIEIVKIYDADWNRVYECSGNCENPTIVPLSDLSPGLYRVHVQMYTADWQWICETDFLEVTVPENAGSRTGGIFVDEKAITLFPNPAQHRLNLKTTPFQGKKGSIDIFNTFGQQVATIPEKKFNQTYESIDISNYQNGLYFMTIKVENRRVINKKFFVEKLE